MRRCLAQNVLFFVDNEIIIVVIILPGPLTLLCCVPASGLLNSFSLQGRSPNALPSLALHDHRTCVFRIRSSQLAMGANIIAISLYAHARIHSHTTHSWNADMPASLSSVCACCVKSFKDIEHSCPNDGTLIGVLRRRSPF